MVKLTSNIIELPRKELKKHRSLECAICQKIINDNAIIVQYPKIKVQVPMHSNCFNETDEEHIEAIARVAQISGEYYK